MPNSGISAFWIVFFSTCVILNYTGKTISCVRPIGQPEERLVGLSTTRWHHQFGIAVMSLTDHRPSLGLDIYTKPNDDVGRGLVSTRATSLIST